MNPYNDKHVKRLLTSSEWSKRKLSPFRVQHAKAVEESCPSYYGQDSNIRRPLNLLAMGRTIYTRYLVANYPQILASTKIPQRKRMALAMEANVNHTLRKLRFKNPLTAAVNDAMFTMGIVQCAQEAGGMVQTPVGPMQKPVSYIRHIPFADWFHDMTATSWDQIRYSGHQDCLPYAFVMESGQFNNTDGLKPNYYDDEQRNKDQRASDISTGTDKANEEHDEDLLVEYYWLPRDGLVLTIPVGKEKPIHVAEWTGPDIGPYHLLAFGEVPSNLVPAAPLQYWRDLNELCNEVMIKLGQQACREKTVTGVEDVAASDANRYIPAEDGQFIKMQHPEKMKQVKSGGVNAASMAFLLQVRDLISYLGGNLDSLGGLSAVSDTARQESLIASSASKSVAEMGDRTEEFVTGICEALASFDFANPLTQNTVFVRSPFKGFDVPVSYSASRNMGSFADFEITIEPNSMRHKSPEQHAQALRTLVGDMVPFLQAAMEQGGRFNFRAFQEAMARFTGVVEASEIFQFGGEPQDVAQASSAGAAQPANTTRRYVHQSQPSQNGANNNAAMIEALLRSASAAPAEAA